MCVLQQVGPSWVSGDGQVVSPPTREPCPPGTNKQPRWLYGQARGLGMGVTATGRERPGWLFRLPGNKMFHPSLEENNPGDSFPLFFFLTILACYGRATDSPRRDSFKLPLPFLCLSSIYTCMCVNPPSLPHRNLHSYPAVPNLPLAFS